MPARTADNTQIQITTHERAGRTTAGTRARRLYRCRRGMCARAVWFPLSGRWVSLFHCQTNTFESAFARHGRSGMVRCGGGGGNGFHCCPCFRVARRGERRTHARAHTHTSGVRGTYACGVRVPRSSAVAVAHRTGKGNCLFFFGSSGGKNNKTVSFRLLAKPIYVRSYYGINSVPTIETKIKFLSSISVMVLGQWHNFKRFLLDGTTGRIFHQKNPSRAIQPICQRIWTLFFS